MGVPGLLATAPSTPWTRWSATVHRGTPGSAGPPPAPTTLANLLPARLTAALTVALAPVVGGRPGAALRVWRRDGRRHPSPNAGPVEAAFAGALGRTLGGRLSYGGRVEDRPLLGNGPAPDVADVERAARLSAAVSPAAAVLAVALRSLVVGATARAARR